MDHELVGWWTGTVKEFGKSVFVEGAHSSGMAGISLSVCLLWATEYQREPETLAMTSKIQGEPPRNN